MQFILDLKLIIRPKHVYWKKNEKPGNFWKNIAQHALKIYMVIDKIDFYLKKIKLNKF